WEIIVGELFRCNDQTFKGIAAGHGNILAWHQDSGIAIQRNIIRNQRNIRSRYKRAFRCAIAFNSRRGGSVTDPVRLESGVVATIMYLISKSYVHRVRFIGSQADVRAPIIYITKHAGFSRADLLRNLVDPGDVIHTRPNIVKTRKYIKLVSSKTTRPLLCITGIRRVGYSIVNGKHVFLAIIVGYFMFVIIILP